GEVANITTAKYGDIDYEWGIKNASTDFVSTALGMHGKNLLFINIFIRAMFVTVSEALNRSDVLNQIVTALPSLHPGFAIPTIDDGGNHTPGFQTSAASLEAHYACLDVTKVLAATGIRVLIDDEFFSKVKKAYDDDAEIHDFFREKQI
ncbi:hypothetical protein C0993_006069, partial [Termitomyces sp. T159_Od127]